MSNLIGLLTAVRGTSVALTVVGVYTEGDMTSYDCIYVVNGEIKRTNVAENALIGFGDTLTYSEGAFVDAYFANLSDDDDDEDDDDEDEEEEEDDEDREPGDHDELKN